MRAVRSRICNSMPRPRTTWARWPWPGQVRRDGARWQGALNTLRIAPAKGEPWQLRQAAISAWPGSAFSLSESCLAPGSGGALCVSADWPKQGLTLRGDALPLALVQPWLPPNSGRKMYLRGDLSIDGSFKPAGNAWQGSLRLASREGGLRLGDNARGELLRYDQFSFVTDFSAQHIHSKLGIGFQGDGFVDATVDTGWDAYAPLTGEIYMNMARLYWLELFSPDLVRPKGLVEGHVSLRGTRSQPAMGGDATLSNFTGELPALGLTLSEGKGRFDAQPDGSARIVASVKSGEGTLNVDGGLSWYGDRTPLQLNIRGTNVLVSNTAELRAVANPDLQFGIANNTMMLSGQVTVPSADIDLERLDRGTSLSEDVVVLDPADPEATPTSPLEMDLRVTLGDQVKMAGFGLKGALTGAMQVRSRPGREMTATGGLDVSGKYKAYGQDLTITRGQLTWSNNIVSDPRINIRAQRQGPDVTRRHRRHRPRHRPACGRVVGPVDVAIRGDVLPGAGPQPQQHQQRRSRPGHRRGQRPVGRQRPARLATRRQARLRRRRRQPVAHARRLGGRLRQIPLAETLRQLRRVADRQRLGADAEISARPRLRRRSGIEHGGEPRVGELAEGEVVRRLSTAHAATAKSP